MTTPITVTTIPFSKLVAVDEINARGATKEGIDELAKSIAAKGLIQPLAVRPADGSDKHEVIDGARRYRAMAKLVKAKTWKKDQPVPVIVRNEDDAEALETSLVANTVRLPVHPVDQHEVFARLSEQGRSDADIAARFGIAEKTVRQHKALGRLAPEIRAAWRKGKIDAKAAQAFAVHPDPAVQAAAYERLKKDGSYGLSEHTVRHALAGKRVAIHADEVVFAGLDTYLAAGGTTTESLFDDESYIDDGALLKKLVRDRLEAERAKLAADGWAWVEIADDIPATSSWCDRWQSWSYVKGVDWDPPETYDPGAHTPEEKARAGCVIQMAWGGEGVEIYDGLVRPDAAADGAADTMDAEDRDEDVEDGAWPEDDAVDDPEDDPAEAAEAAEPAGAFAVTDALRQSLSEALTIAAAEVVASGADPRLTLRLLAAALAAQYQSPARIKSEGARVVRAPYAATTPSFAMSFEGLWDQTEAALIAALGPLLAQSLDLTFDTQRYHGPKPDGVTALVRALPPALYLAAARRHFNAGDYFKRASMGVARAALEEMGETVGAGAKKGPLTQLAADQAVRRGWLPPELRTPAYALLPAVRAEAAE